MQTKVKLTKRVVSLATALVTGLSAVGVTGIPGGYLERYLQAQRTVIITSTAFVLTRAVLLRMSRQQKKMVHIRSQTPETSTGSQSR